MLQYVFSFHKYSVYCNNISSLVQSHGQNWYHYHVMGSHHIKYCLFGVRLEIIICYSGKHYVWYFLTLIFYHDYYELDFFKDIWRISYGYCIFENLLLNEGIFACLRKNWMTMLCEKLMVYTHEYIYFSMTIFFLMNLHSNYPDKDVIWGLLVWFLLYNFCAIILTECETINNTT